MGNGREFLDSPLLTQADGLLLDFEIYHSEFQIDYFIIGQGGRGHLWGMYHQTLREIHTRQCSLRNVSMKLLEMDLDIAKEQIKAKKWAFTRLQKLDRAQAAANYHAKVHTKREANQQKRDTERELARIIYHARRLKEQVGDLTPERRRQLSEDFWVQQIKQKIALSLVQTGALPLDMYQLLSVLPEAVRDEIRPALDNPEAVVKMMTGDVHHVPIPAPTMKLVDKELTK